MLAKEEGIVAGMEVVKRVFTYCNKDIDVKVLINDGQEISPGDKLAVISGSTRDLLKGERTALNFIQRLSGIATKTRKYVDAVSEYSANIVDTRKTTPTLRVLEKYAVTVAGARNHRMGLFDAVMIKDNHILAAGGIENAVVKVKERIAHTVKIEVEVEDMEGVKKALDAGADIIMLDNMGSDLMKEAVQLIGNKALVEASGGITLDNIVDVAATGVDIISVGALTHQINSLDISLNLESVHSSAVLV